MLISANWLSRHVDLEGVDFTTLGDRFTLNVAELEGIMRCHNPIVAGVSWDTCMGGW